MKAERRILEFVKNSNIALFYLALIFTVFTTPIPFALGVIAGGLLVTINFHLMCKSVKEALAPPHKTDMSPALIKYFLRFGVSIAIISMLIIKNCVHPVGLIIGLSIVVVSFFIAAFRESVRIIKS